MFEQAVDLLHRYVERFKAYQKKYDPHITEENDNGEWEIGADCRDEGAIKWYAMPQWNVCLQMYIGME